MPEKDQEEKDESSPKEEFKKAITERMNDEKYEDAYEIADKDT